MRVFEIRQEQNAKTSWIDASHRWNLPGVACPVCKSVWSATGLEYPGVDLTDLPDEILYREARAEPLAKYLYLQRRIADAFPELPVLNPGAEFGPLRGKAVSQRLEGFVWRSWWTICLEISALEGLSDSELSLPVSVKSELEFEGEKQEVFEFDLPLRGRLANPVYDGRQLEYCTACGRDSASLPEEIRIDRASVTNQLDIFRVSNFTTIILVTKKFVDEVENRKIKGAYFEEVQLV